MPEASPIGSPGDCSLSFFAYGSFQPCQLAYNQIAEYKPEPTKATLSNHHLRLRDGLPLLVAGPRQGINEVTGSLLALPGEAYARIGAFEPKEQYRWGKVQADTSSGTHTAWALMGKLPDKGSSGEAFHAWTSADDPALSSGLHVVRGLARDASDRNTPEEQSFATQASLLLLWSIVERIATFRFGAVGGPTKRVKDLGQDAAILEAVRHLGVPSRVPDPYRPLRDSRDLAPVTISPDGGGALLYWYQVRPNLAHRGKEAHADFRLLRETLFDLNNTISTLLLQWLPGLREQWTERDPKGAATDWLLR